MEHIDVAVIGGGQSGLAAAHSLRALGLTPVVLEASEQAAGSWPGYYDSLTLFSPAAHSSLPGMPFGGDPARYPHRDEVVAYLLRYADRLDADIRTRTRVREVRAADEGFTLSWLTAKGCPRVRSLRRPAPSAARTVPGCRAWTASRARCCTLPTTARPSRTRGSVSWSSELGTPLYRSLPNSQRRRG